jgi:hypothetical protein
VEAATRAETTVGREQMEMRVPLEEISSRGEGNDEAGTGAVSGRAADKLEGGLCASSGQLGEEVTPTAKQGPQQARDGQHGVAVGYGSEQLLAPPLGPQELLLLPAGGAEAASAAGEGDEHTATAPRAPQPREAVLEKPALE